MSDSKHQRSVPNERGRHQEKLAKRRAAKQARKLQESDARVERLKTRKEAIDRETKQTDASRL